MVTASEQRLSETEKVRPTQGMVPTVARRIVDGVLCALSVAAVSFGLFAAPRLVTHSGSEPTAYLSDIETLLQSEENQFDPLLYTIGSEAFQQQQAQWAKEQAFNRLAEAKVEATTIVAAASDSATAAIEEAQRDASVIALDQNYAIATTRLHRKPGYEYRIGSETIIDSTNTKTGCDVVLTQTDDLSKKALMTNLAPGSCVPDGTYSAGTVFGRQGEFAVGQRIY